MQTTLLNYTIITLTIPSQQSNKNYQLNNKQTDHNKTTKQSPITIQNTQQPQQNNKQVN